MLEMAKKDLIRVKVYLGRQGQEASANFPSSEDSQSLSKNTFQRDLTLNPKTTQQMSSHIKTYIFPYYDIL